MEAELVERIKEPDEEGLAEGSPSTSSSGARGRRRTWPPLLSQLSSLYEDPAAARGARGGRAARNAGQEPVVRVMQPSTVLTGFARRAKYPRRRSAL